MPRSALSQVEVEQFRDSLCDVATRLFAKKGYEGVTMRALAAELGCSPMTPYRYFQNKDEIFEAVRRAGFQRFAAALETAAAKANGDLEQLHALCRGYVGFALEEPHAYRIMFELDPPGAATSPSLEEAHAWFVMRDTVAAAVESGSLGGTPDVLAHLYWSGVHGLVALHLAGKLVLGCDLEQLIEAFLERELRGDAR
ncbi:MAG: TetR/AcrR family transcriptional regulator [Candidatus Binatia bacterium]|nr:TetR/AcrR family transcriptional regulator [Candidatus Binatia bacterium]